MKYKIDLAIILMFFGVSIDLITTILFLIYTNGIEKNPILAGLVNINILFVPLYLLLPIVVIPLFQDVLRKSFALYFALGGFLLGVNNITVILSDYGIIIDSIGFWWFKIIMALVGLMIFFYLSYKHKLDKEHLIKLIFKAGLFVVYIGILQGIFWLISFIF